MIQDLPDEQLELFFLRFKNMIKSSTMPTVIVQCITQFIEAYKIIYEYQSDAEKKAILDSLLDLELLNEMIRCVTVFPNYRDDINFTFLNDKIKEKLDQDPDNDMIKASIELVRRNFSFGNVIPTISDISTDPCIYKNVDKYPNLFTYLQTHFLLLKEEFLYPLRKFIRTKRESNCDVTDIQLQKMVHSYNHVYVDMYDSDYDSDLYWLKIRNLNTSRKNMSYGSLVFISSDGFANDLAVGIIVRKSEDSAAVRIVDGMLITFDGLEMVESKAFFECSRYILESLRHMSWWQTDFPFQEILVHGSINFNTPKYLNDIYLDIGCITTTKNTQLVKIDQLALSSSETTLEEQQYAAFQYICSHNLAVIQGPPGTGKSFIGVKFIQLLLENLQSLRVAKQLGLPILIVCQTNHSLDAFLESILHMMTQEKIQRDSKEPIRLLRLGGRCKSTQLTNNLMFNQLKFNQALKAVKEDLNNKINHEMSEVFIKQNIIINAATDIIKTSNMWNSHLEKNAIIEKLGESFNSSDPSSIYADIDAMVLRKLQFFDLLNISRYALMTFISKDVFRQSD
jgi:hypothetical protein